MMDRHETMEKEGTRPGSATARWPAILSALLIAGVTGVAAGCEDGPTDPDDGDGRVGLTFDLTEGNQGWSGDFADYPVGEADAMNLVVDRRPLPESVALQDSALLIAGQNTSDDLFMFLKRRIGDLEPGRQYALTFTVEFASDAPSDCVGIGGPPGEAVTVKAGATQVEPVPVVEENPGEGPDYYRMNIDKGNQSDGGTAMQILGDVATGPGDCTNPEFELKTLVSPEPFLATADEDGELWVIVGTDSGFEGTTALFYTRIEILPEAR